ncbi:allantoicase-like [Diachasmimorpha longicaudata]|uniref:allantoicase-like n=1 Tax=Diachasmimorpha longicaudata TaxID=58733 RepID=UPI0030B87DE5
MATMDMNELDFLELDEVASEKSGGRILFATDDWFAAAENLLKDCEPEWKENVFTDFGKWMDGWETRRKRCAGHDWAIIALHQPSIIRGFCVDTAYFTGNYAPRISIQAARLSDDDVKLFPKRCRKLGSAATAQESQEVSRLKTEDWETIVPMTELGSGYPETRHNYIASSSTSAWTHLRLNLFPDGGVARLRVYGTICSNPLNPDALTDLVAQENGGICEHYSNAHYGHPRNIIRPGRGINMADGWETARRLDRPPIIEVDRSGILQVPGNEWAVFKLAHIGIIDSIIIDTTHFKGNFPDNAKVEGTLINSDDDKTHSRWKTILSTKKLSAHKPHVYACEDLDWHGPVSHVRLTIAPDGGISRFRIFGYAHA